MGALRRQNQKLERECAMAYGLVVGHNAFAWPLLENYQESSKAVGALHEPKTPVVDPDRRRESLLFNPKPQVSSTCSGSGVGWTVVSHRVLGRHLLGLDRRLLALDRREVIFSSPCVFHFGFLVLLVGFLVGWL